MRALPLVLMLMTVGCSKNLEALREAEVKAERRLSERKKVANDYVLVNRQVAMLENQLRESPAPPSDTVQHAPPIEVPAISPFENEEAKRARLNIAATENEINALDVIVARTKELSARKAQLEARLDAAEARH